MMTKHSARSVLWAVPVVALLSVASCGSDSSSTTPPSSAAVTAEATDPQTTDPAASGTSTTSPTTSGPAATTATTTAAPTTTARAATTTTAATATTSAGTTGAGGAFTDPDGRWTATFPAPPVRTAQALPEGIQLATYASSVGDDQYVVANSTDDPASFDLPSFDLDASVKAVLASIGATETSTTTTPTTVDGYRALRYSGSATKGGQTADIEGVTLVTDTEFIEVIVIDVDEDNAADVQRFIDSFHTV